jgi:hypothetical protein
VSCIPIWMAGYLYSRQRRKAGPFRALLLGHLLLLGNYITYIACWRGFLRLIVGANGWQKTTRHRERSHRADRRRQPAPQAAVSAPTRAGLEPAAPPWPVPIPAQRLPAERLPAERIASAAELLDPADLTAELVGVVVPPGAAGRPARAGTRRTGGGSHRAARGRQKVPAAR